MIRVFLADDHPIVRQGLCRMIGEQDDMTVAGEATARACCAPRTPPGTCCS
ncbi:MAG: hypothetical protein U0325_10885 [Polyangiales bacterium]